MKCCFCRTAWFKSTLSHQMYLTNVLADRLICELGRVFDGVSFLTYSRTTAAPEATCVSAAACVSG